MDRLKGMGYLILVVAALLVLNSIFISDHFASVRTYTEEENLIQDIGLNVGTSLSILRGNALLFGETGDAMYQQRFLEMQAEVTTQLEEIISENFQPEFRNTLTEAELVQYNATIESLREINQLVGQEFLSGQPHPVTTSEFTYAYLELSEPLRAITTVLERNRLDLNDSLFRNQKIMEYTLISLIILLFFSAVFVFRLISRENRWHRYFHQLYSTITDNVSVGLSIMDPEGHYEYMNDSYKAMLEIEGLDAKGLTVEEIFTEDISRQLTAWQTTDATRTEGHLTLEFEDGQKHIDYDRFVIYDENNQPKYVDFLQNNTQVAEMQTQLKQQLADIEFYAKAKDAFVANMSHELRTPVNAILGITHLLSKTPLSSQQQTYVQKIESSSEMLKSLVCDVLDLSKIRAQALKLYPTDFRLQDAITAVEDMFLTELQRKELTWHLEALFPAELRVLGDRTRILQILINLMSNAVKFTQAGSITLSVIMTGETANDVDLEFSVEDTGLGISKKDISTLFQEFHQLENHLTKQHKGTGLGLCISKSLAELMGGHMWVTSILGAGSKFSFSLRLPKANAAQPLPQTVTERITFAPGTRPVLVVDDTDINREITVTLLEAVGLSCQTASDGQEAVDLCRRQPADYFSLVLMDIHMPRLNGFEAAKLLKNELAIQAPVVALTATSADEKTELLHEGAIADFIMKPFKAEYLYDTVSQYLPSNPVPSAPVQMPDADPALTVPTGSSSPRAETSVPVPDPFAGRLRAIEGMGGLASIYYKHVAKFKVNYADAAAQIQNLIHQARRPGNQWDEEQWTEAKRLVHSIKGLSGTLGMDALYESATTLDKLLGKGPGNRSLEKVNAALDEFRSTLAAVIASAPAVLRHPDI